MFFSLTLLLAILPSLFAKAVLNQTANGDLKTWGQLDFQIQVCTSAGNCQTENNGVHIDASWLGCSNPIGCTNVKNKRDLYLTQLILLRIIKCSY